MADRLGDDQGDERPFAAVYARHWQEARRLEWAAYVDGMPLDRSAVDGAIFEAAADPAGPRAVPADLDAVERLRRRSLVDHHREVSRLRDRLDERSAYSVDRSSPTWRLDRAAAMEPDVQALIRLRAALARDLGGSSYAQLAAAAEGIDPDALIASLEELRDAALPAASRIAAEAGLTIETWFDGLDAMAGPAVGDPVSISRLVAARIGCADLLGAVTWTVRDAPLAGWAAGVSIPEDVRLLVRPVRSLRDITTVLHELGHALAYAATRSHGIRAIPTDTQDEALATAFEIVASRFVLDSDQRARLADVAIAELARVSTSALFELDLEARPAAARERFVAWYAPLAPVRDPVVWALDSFRSVDPFRIHAYALGSRLGDRLAARLASTFGDDTVAWGRWLKETLWAPGRRDTYAELEALVAPDVATEPRSRRSPGSSGTG